ncbi:unnamed protein product [Effrenium voratum]|uniref:CSD domain-containing protein n=1 Tax=Effrenium voratum TaxID=2562239 RepID=A0AA36JGD4_9DINO|nr:unnamed protein product [Effrenium voratum]
MSATGPCKSFNGMKGWGFIDYGGQDVFVHIKDCTGGQPAPGDMLSFDLEESQPGRFKAKNVNGGTAPRDQDAMMGKVTPVEGTGAYTGSVKSFNVQKGFGFISMEGGQDVFVHMKGCVGTLPNAGDIVKFDMEPSPTKPGQFQAKNVTGGTAPFQQPGMMGGMGKGYGMGMMGGMMGPYGKGKMGKGGYGGYGGYGW